MTMHCDQHKAFRAVYSNYNYNNEEIILKNKEDRQKKKKYNRLIAQRNYITFTMFFFYLLFARIDATLASLSL